MQEPLLVGGQPLKYNVVSCLQNKPKDKVQQIAKTFNIPLEIAILNTKFSMNAAMVIRTSAVFGLQKVHIIGPKACDMRSAVGSQHYVEIVKPGEINPETYFHDLGLIPILVEQGGEPLEEFDFKPFIRQKKTICFVMGNETTGLSDEYLKQSFKKISISQMGVLRSLNVQVAASIITYEFSKQWRAYYKDL